MRRDKEHSLSDDFCLVPVNDILSKGESAEPNPVNTVDRGRHTLTIVTKVDWNSDGFTLGSSIVELDWND